MEKYILDEFNKWLHSDYIDEKDKLELKNIENNEKEIVERFYRSLEFGTGGLRGIRGIGKNRISKYTIRLATQGLANYMLKFEGEKSIVISHDSRIGSREYALNTARVMAANGIKAYLFEDLRPTPELSFAARYFKTLAGVMVTASHNPKEYNGYKVYWDDGAQIVSPHDVKIIEEVNKISGLSDVKLISEKEAVEKGLLEIISRNIDDEFLKEVLKQQVNPGILTKNASIEKSYAKLNSGNIPDSLDSMGLKSVNIVSEKIVSDFKLVYTPLNGCGIRGVPEALDAIGVHNLYLVKEQATADGNFPTLSYPNPEDPKVFDLGIKLADEKNAKYIIATDPDCDRVGTAVKGINGEWYFPNGNQIGILLTDYILSNTDKIPENGAVISTIVSTKMLDSICENYNVKAIRTLTGFKYIGEKIKEFKKDNSFEYIFGFEESYGYLKGTHSRDKDAVVGAMLVAEMFAYFDSIKITVEEKLEILYKKYGYFREGISAISMPGKEGIERITKIVTHLRENTPKKIDGKTITVIRDFKTSIEKNTITNSESKINLPSSNVLQFELSDESIITIRPSGTEPKIKIYICVKSNSTKTANIKIENYKKVFEKIVFDI